MAGKLVDVTSGVVEPSMPTMATIVVLPVSVVKDPETVTVATVMIATVVVRKEKAVEMWVSAVSGVSVATVVPVSPASFVVVNVTVAAAEGAATPPSGVAKV